LRVGHSEFTPGISVFAVILSATMAGKGKRKKSESASVEMQMQISINQNPPSIPFEKPKKSKERSDDEGNYNKIELPIEPDKENSKTIEKKVHLLKILICHLKRG
jgi:hypothetical protein